MPWNGSTEPFLGGCDMSTDCPLPSPPFFLICNFGGFLSWRESRSVAARRDLVLPLPPLVWPEGLLLLLESEL